VLLPRTYGEGAKPYGTGLSDGELVDILKSSIELTLAQPASPGDVGVADCACRERYENAK
jgi:hypothetical protein